MAHTTADARRFLRQMGVRTELGEEDMAAIMSRSSSGSTASSAHGGEGVTPPSTAETPVLPTATAAWGRHGVRAVGEGDDVAGTPLFASPTPPSTTPSTGSRGGGRWHGRDDAHSPALSLPPDVLDDMRVAAAMHGGGMSGAPVHYPRSAGIMAMTHDMRREYEARIEQLVEELTTARHEKRMVEVEAARAAATAAGQLGAAREEAAAAAAVARSTQSNLEATVRDLQSRLEASKLPFRDLTISPALHEDLRRQPQERLSLLQFIQLQVHEHVLAAQAKTEEARREAEAVRDAAGRAEAEAEAYRRATTARITTLEGREAGLKAALTAAEEANHRLQERVTALTSQLDELGGKGRAFDSVQARCRELETLLQRDGALVAAHTAALGVAKDDRMAAVAESRDLQRKVELLTADRAALTTGLEEARAQVRRLSDQLTHAEDRLREAVREKDAVQHQLLATSVDLRAAGGEAVQAEVRRLREANARDVEEARAAMKESYEREIRSLRDAKADAVTDMMRLQSRLDALQRAFDEATSAARTTDADTVALAAELRSQLKVKSFELERASMAMAEQGEALSRLRGEMDAARDRLATLHEAHVTLQATSQQRIDALTHELAMERERVAVYDRLEAELDTAILTAGGVQEAAEHDATIASLIAPGATGGDGGSSGAGRDAGAAEGDTRHLGRATTSLARLMDASVGFTLASGVPTTARRRLRQTVSLAKELMAAQRDVAALKQRCAGLQRVADDATATATALRAQLDAVKGPPEYLIAEVRRMEEETAAAKMEARDVRAQLTLARQTLAETEAARVTAEANMKRLATTRADVDGLIALVQQAMEVRKVGALVHPSTMGAHAPSTGTSGGSGDVDSLRAMLAAAASMLLGQGSAAGGSRMDQHAPAATPASTPAVGTARNTPPHREARLSTGSVEVECKPSAPAAPHYAHGSEDAAQYRAEAPLASGITYVATGGTGAPASRLRAGGGTVPAVDAVSAGGAGATSRWAAAIADRPVAAGFTLGSGPRWHRRVAPGAM